MFSLRMDQQPTKNWVTKESKNGGLSPQLFFTLHTGIFIVADLYQLYLQMHVEMRGGGISECSLARGIQPWWSNGENRRGTHGGSTHQWQILFSEIQQLAGLPARKNTLRSWSDGIACYFSMTDDKQCPLFKEVFLRHQCPFSILESKFKRGILKTSILLCVPRGSEK
jgi:hypothetical protein